VIVKASSRSLPKALLTEVLANWPICDEARLRFSVHSPQLILPYFVPSQFLLLRSLFSP